MQYVNASKFWHKHPNGPKLAAGNLQLLQFVESGKKFTLPLILESGRVSKIIKIPEKDSFFGCRLSL